MKNIHILDYKEGNWFISVGTVGDNNGKKYQSYNLSINANINSVKRYSDDRTIIANGNKYKSKHSKFYLTHLWYNNSLDTICCGGYYTADNKKKDEYFSPNICTINDII